jgi:hypothetical protein
MCKGKKKCNSCNSIKIGNTMAKKRSRSRGGVTFKMEDLAIAGGSAVVALGANKFINTVVAKQSETVQQYLGYGIPMLKAAVGGYLATKKGMSRTMRVAGLGVAATGAMELGIKLLPEFVGIGSPGDAYTSLIGATDPILRLSVDPSSSGVGASAIYGAEKEEALVIQ